MNGEPSPPGRVLRDRFWIVGPVGLLLAFFWQPALRLIAPFVLTAVSSLLVLALVLFERAASTKMRRLSRSFYLLSFLLGGLGIAEAMYFASRALSVSDANDRRCLRIETHMLADAHGRAADAAMFQALGRRPQGLDQVASPSVPRQGANGPELPTNASRPN